MQTFNEVEDKYDVGPGFAVPPLAGAGVIAAVDAPRVDELIAVYYDTADFRLARSKIVLRRRSGGSDAGWHLKLPTAGARTEVHRPLGRGERVPTAVGSLVYGRTRGLPLAPVARLSTTRTTYTLRDAGGNALAELADDRVHAEVFAAEGRAAELSDWRELEVELVGDKRKVRKHARRVLRDAGAEPSARPSKFGGLIADRIPAGPDLPMPRTLHRHSSAREVIQAYLCEHLQRLLDADLRMRFDGPESVHDMRVASRRMRSTLKTFRPMLVDADARDLEERLRDLGLRLGVARDSEVLLERLLGFLDELPETFVLGPVRRRLQEDLHGKHSRSRSEALTFMGSAEYAKLLDDLVAFVDVGFTAEIADQPAAKVLPKMVRRSARKLVRRVHAAFEASAGAEREHALHRARKAAKQARYAGEATSPAFGRAAATLAEHAKEIQQILGEHQDSVVACDVLRDFAIAADGRANESAFTFGVLAGLERAYGADARRRFDVLWSPAVAKQMLRALR